MNSEKPTFYFIGKISDRTARYQVQDKDLGDGFNLAIFLDGVTITVASGTPFPILLENVREILDTIISAFVFKTKKPLSYALDSWVEAKKGSPEESIIGWILPKHTETKVSTQKSHINTPWKKAIFFHRNLSLGNNNHRLALKDYRQAVTDTSADAFLYAYRALEDICRAATGEEQAQNGWVKMHKLLGTLSAQLTELTKISTAVRHGNVNDPVVIKALTKKKDHLETVHEFLSKEFTRTFKNF